MILYQEQKFWIITRGRRCGKWFIGLIGCRIIFSEAKVLMQKPVFDIQYSLDTFLLNAFPSWEC